MRPEPVALLDEQRLAGHAATIQLVRPHPVARPPSASESDRHHHRVFPALLHLPSLHGALLDLDEFRPAPEPGGAAAVAEGVNALRPRRDYRPEASTRSARSFTLTQPPRL